MFYKYNYCVLFGPSNAGKTTHFLNENFCGPKRILISVLEINDILPLNMSLDEFNARCLYINLAKLSFLDIDKMDRNFRLAHICVDEIHFFNEKHLNLLDFFLNKYPNLNLYFTMLSQSHCNTLLANTSTVLANADNIMLFEAKCYICSRLTIQSVCRISENLNTEIFCGKSKFSPQCKACKLKIN